MKNHEVIARLLALPLDAEVQTEGCDCFGDIGQVVLYGSSIMLARSGFESCWWGEKVGVAPVAEPARVIEVIQQQLMLNAGRTP
jgi:hypothetical protein